MTYSNQPVLGSLRYMARLEYSLRASKARREARAATWPLIECRHVAPLNAAQIRWAAHELLWQYRARMSASK